MSTAPFSQVKFTASYADASALPASPLPEFSFVGRSNVGKSSLMNKIFGRKNLVKVSSTPGKTTTINWFDVPGATFIDLPGYGFAQVSKSDRERWRPLVEGYFEQDRTFGQVFVLVDVRHDASKLDIQMISYLAQHELPFSIVFTKADKLSASKQRKQVSALCKQLGATGDTYVFVTSSADGQGIEDVRAFIASCMA